MLNKENTCCCTCKSPRW